MKAVYAWVQNLIFCLCLLELFCHLVRSSEYRRYIRFFGGLVVLAMAFDPLESFFSVGTSFDGALQRAFAREEAYELQVSQKALAGLQNQKILEAYQAELKRQIGSIVQAHGCQSSAVQVAVREEKDRPVELTGVDVLLAPRNSGLNVFEENEADRAEQEAAAREIKAEIAAVYGVDINAVTVTVKE